MRLPLLLGTLLVLAGCVAPDGKLTTASTEEAPAPEPPAPTPASPTPQPIPTSPPPPTTPPANQTTEPPAPPEPQDAPDHHAEQEGWVVAAPPEPGMTVRMPVPVQAGARNLTVHARAYAVTPLPAAPPVEPANVTVTLLGPDGAALASKAGELTSPSVVLEWSDLARAGEYVAVIALKGASHGDQAGHRYHAVVHVTY